MSIKIVDPVGKQKDFEDFCRLPASLFISIGFDYVNKPRPKWIKVLMKCYALTAIISHLYCITFVAKGTISMSLSDDVDLALLLRLISGINYALCSTFKIVSFLWRLKHSREIYHTLHEIFPKTKTDKITYKIQQYFWPKWILFIIYFYLGATAFISSSPLLGGVIAYIIQAVKVGFTETKFGYFKLYEIDYAFDHHSPLAYLVTYAIELMHAHIIVICNICADIWLLCFSVQLCMHFDYLARTLEEYKPDKTNFEKDQQFIANLVKKHQILLNLSDGLNYVFGVLILIILMSTAATLCSAGVYMITQGVGRELIEYVAFLPTAIGQYYLICHYGQQLMITSQNLAVAAYNHAWYNGSKSYKKSILIIFMRSQKGVEINANGFQPICLETFKMVMGATYRVFTLLKKTMI